MEFLAPLLTMPLGSRTSRRSARDYMRLDEKRKRAFDLPDEPEIIRIDEPAGHSAGSSIVHVSDSGRSPRLSQAGQCVIVYGPVRSLRLSVQPDRSGPR